jgi:hypothetical protein
MMLPYLGLSIPTGDGSEGLGTSLRLGGLFGFYAGQFLSLNGELSIDVLNIDTPSGVSASGAAVGFTFSPLFHFGPPRMDFVVGPRLGFFGTSETYSYDDGYSPDDDYSSTGFLYGFNAGAFFSLGRISLGGLLSVSIHSISSACRNDDCGDPPSGTPALKIVGLSGAMLW